MEEKTIVKKKKNHYFETYISKVLKQTTENCGITGNAKQQLNSFLCIFCKYISNIINRLTIIGKKKTISEKEIINALHVVLTGELLSNSLNEGEKSIISFKNNVNTKGSRQNKSNIIFPPSIVEKFLRNFGTSKLMITSLAPVFLAAVLEYITYEIIDLASITAKDNKRVRITIRDLEVVIRCDVELNKLFNKLNASFLGGGVLPFIHSSLLNKKKKKKKNIINLNLNKPHRFRPGTVAIREIKKQQKSSDCLILAKSAFEKIVRNIFKENKFDLTNEEEKNIDNIKISKDVFIILQYFIEQYIVKILYNANFLAIHSGRVKLIPTDIALVSYFFNDSKNPYTNNTKNNQKLLDIFVANNVVENDDEEENDDEYDIENDDLNESEETDDNFDS
jgi:histone H2A